MPIIKHCAVEDRWLTELARRPCFNILLNEDGTCLLHLAEQLRVVGAFATWKIDEQDTSLSELAQSIGFCHAETSLVFSLSPGKFRKPKAKAVCSVAAAGPADEKTVVEIARSAFSFTRFHRDLRLGSEIGDRVKAAWVQNYFRGQRGDGMLVAHKGAQIVGFLLYIRNADGDLTIDLIAVAPNATRQGVAQALVDALFDKLEDKQLVKVGTQSCNVPSHNLYSSLGFQLVRTVSVFHYHADYLVERHSRNLETPR